MTLRVFEEGWRNQYDRMRRSRARLENVYGTSDEFDDAFYHAVQDAWHLKDWIKEDDALPEELRFEIKSKVESEESIGIVADLANCTKHLILTKRIHQHARLQSTHSTINLGNKHMTREIEVLLRDGTTCSGIILLDRAIDTWNKLLGQYGLI